MSNPQNPVYHHFKGDRVTRSELVERTVTQIILKSEMPDEERVWSKTFELKHSASVAKIGRILAQKRGLDEEIAAIACALHDIYVFKTGNGSNHAKLGAPIADQILRETGKFKEEEISQIVKAVEHHSNKHIHSDDPYVELVKDADVFDCSLFEGAHDAYVYEKSEDICKQYFDRVKAVRNELGLPHEEKWDKCEMIGEEAIKYIEEQSKKSSS